MMGFLKFCGIEFVKTVLLLIVIVLLVIGSTYIPEWGWAIILLLVFAYVFLRCWWEEYEKQEFLKRK